MININETVKNAYTKYGKKEYIYEKVDNKYQSITYGDFITKATYLADYLLSKNLKDEYIILYSENQTKLMISDLAILSYVGVSVSIPIFYTSKEINEAINNLNIKCIIYSNTKQEEITKVKESYPNLIYISLEDDLENCLDEGKKISDKKDSIFDLPNKNHEECSKIVFSSGTTSKPKAVMLSLKNIFSGWASLNRRVDLNENDIIYLYLPLTHTYAEIYNFLFSFLSGLSIYLCSDIKNIGAELQEVNPTLFCSVPYIYITMLEKAGDKVKYAFGNRIKYLFAGGSKFNIELKQKYLDYGLFILDAYALSETASSLSISYPDNIIDDSVGTIFEDIDVKIDNLDERGVGEILVKGDNVFIGYANEPELTKKVIDKDGYFHTGDIGYIKENKLYFVDRIKTMLVTSKGENINTAVIKDTINKLYKNIDKINLYIDNDKLCCDIFTSDKSLNKDEVLSKLNKELLKSEKIDILNIKENNAIKKC